MTLIIIAIVLSRTALEYSLISIKKQDIYLQGMILVSNLYIVSCYYGAIYFGIIGVILASIFAELIYTGYILYHLRHLDKFFDYLILFSKAIIVGVCSYMVYIIPNQFNEYAKISVLYFVFFMGLLLAKIISKEEIINIASSIKPGNDK